MLQTALKVIEGKNSGKVIPLDNGKFLVGREHDCHLRPNNETISRHHCVFKTDAFTVRLRDLGSTNGTFVNGERISTVTILKNGDTVHIGKLAFQVSIKEIEEEATDTATIEVHDTSIKIPETPVAPSALDDSAIHNPNVGGGTTIITTVDSLPAETPAQTTPASVPVQQQMPQAGVPVQQYQQQPQYQQPVPGYPVGQIPYPQQQVPYQQQPGIAYPQQQVAPQQPMPGQQPPPESPPQAGKIPVPPVKLPPPPGAEDSPSAGK